MEKLGIAQMGLSRDVDNLLVGSKVGDASNVFHLADEKIVWYCKFKPGLGRIGASLARSKFMATWYEPSGKVYHLESFTYSFGNAALYRNAIHLDRSRGRELIGKWRVEVRRKDELIDDREFEVTE